MEDHSPEIINEPLPRIERYLDHIELTQDGIAILQDGVFKVVNSALEIMSGYQRDELIGMPFTVLLTEDCRDRVVEMYQARLAGKSVPSINEVTGLNKKGEVRNIAVNSAIVEYEGKVASELVVRDITEQKRTEEALRQSEKKIRNLIEQTHDGFVLIDEAGSVAEWNRAMEDITALTKAEVLGQSIWDVILKSDVTRPEEQSRRLKRQTMEFLTAGEATWSEHEANIRRHDGEVRTVMVAVFPIETENGFMAGSIYRDITERKRIEEALRENEAKLRLMFESVTEGIAVTDLNGIITDVNERMLTIGGHAPGMRCWGRVPLSLLLRVTMNWPRPIFIRPWSRGLRIIWNTAWSERTAASSPGN